MYSIRSVISDEHIDNGRLIYGISCIMSLKSDMIFVIYMGVGRHLKPWLHYIMQENYSPSSSNVL